MSGWGVLVFATIGIVAYYFGTQAHGNRSARSADGGADTDGDLKMSDFSWAPGHHADGGSIGGHHGGASGDFSGGGDSGGASGDSGSF